MVIDQVTADDRLIGASTPMPRGAVIGCLTAKPVVDLAIPKDHETRLSERGTYLLLTELTDPLAIGRAYPLTLRFERGGEVAAQLSVDCALFL